MLYEFENELGELTSTIIADYFNFPVINRRIQVPGVGDLAPAFSLNQYEHILQHADAGDINIISSEDLLAEKPLVISFFDPDWSESYAELFLSILENTYHKIRGLGGELIVLTPAPVLSIANLIRKTDASFGIYQDLGKEIAEKYGVYSSRFPAYERISGVEKDIVLPATFVVAQNRTIVYTSVDEDFDNPFAVKDLLTAVYSVKP
jgi:peroxiredoxin